MLTLSIIFTGLYVSYVAKQTYNTLYEVDYYMKKAY